MQHFKQRWPFFLLGLTIGIVFVAFFWSKKETEFNYGSKARFLSNISKKELIVSKEVCDFLIENNLDERVFLEVMTHGEIDFWNKKSVGDCTEYKITGSNSLRNFKFVLRNCDQKAMILNFIAD